MLPRSGGREKRGKMTKRFKLKISRVIIPSFRLCRSRNPSDMPENPIPSFRRLSLTAATKTTDDDVEVHKFHNPHFSVSSSSSSEYSWLKEEKWLEIAKLHDESPRRKIYTSSVFSHSGDSLFPFSSPITVKKKTTPSTSSAESTFFSSEAGDDDRETETLVSYSRSFSIASLETEKTKNKNRVKKVKNLNHYVLMEKNGDEDSSPTRLSVFQKLIPCTVDGKVRESFAVVKKSENPQDDFRRSMMEMILEKQMFEEKDLEQLLHCFLSLNSRDHHDVILEVFSEIWIALFCKI